MANLTCELSINEGELSAHQSKIQFQDMSMTQEEQNGD